VYPYPVALSAFIGFFGASGISFLLLTPSEYQIEDVREASRTARLRPETGDLL